MRVRRRRSIGVVEAATVLIATLVSATSAAPPTDRGNAPYRASITYTEYGMPHITAIDNLGVTC